MTPLGCDTGLILISPALGVTQILVYLNGISSVIRTGEFALFAIQVSNKSSFVQCLEPFCSRKERVEYESIHDEKSQRQTRNL